MILTRATMRALTGSCVVSIETPGEVRLGDAVAGPGIAPDTFIIGRLDGGWLLSAPVAMTGDALAGVLIARGDEERIATLAAAVIDFRRSMIDARTEAAELGRTIDVALGILREMQAAPGGYDEEPF